MRLRLTDTTLRIALATLFGLVLATILGTLLVLSIQKTTVIALPSTAKGGGLRDIVQPHRLRACGQNDIDCLNVASQVSQLDNKLSLLAMAQEVEFLRLDDYSNSNALRHKALWANYIASWVLLFVVLLIVGCGLYMSMLQLRIDLASGKPNANSLKISREGLEVNSPVIGLLIFLASTYFFSVYVEKVYPVTFVSTNGGDAPVRAAGAPSSGASHNEGPGK